MTKPSLTAAATFGVALLLSPVAEAAELKVIAGGSLAPLMNEFGPQFEKASGHKLAIHFN